MKWCSLIFDYFFSVLLQNILLAFTTKLQPIVLVEEQIGSFTNFSCDICAFGACWSANSKLLSLVPFSLLLRLSTLSKENKQQTVQSIPRANDRFIIQHISLLVFFFILFFIRSLSPALHFTSFLWMIFTPPPRASVLQFPFLRRVMHNTRKCLHNFCFSAHIFPFFVLDFSSVARRLWRRVWFVHRAYHTVDDIVGARTTVNSQHANDAKESAKTNNNNISNAGKNLFFYHHHCCRCRHYSQLRSSSSLNQRICSKRKQTFSSKQFFRCATYTCVWDGVWITIINA